MEKKIEDYLHLYVGCKFVMKIKGTEELTAEMTFGYEALCATFSGKREDLISPILILRPLASMTEEEWRSNWDKFSVNVANSVSSPNLNYADRPKWVQVLENRLHTNTLTFNDGMILLRMGFDLFGLIQSGLAISTTKPQP